MLKMVKVRHLLSKESANRPERYLTKEMLMLLDEITTRHSPFLFLGSCSYSSDSLLLCVPDRGWLFLFPVLFFLLCSVG